MTTGGFNKKNLLKAGGLALLLAGAILTIRIPAVRSFLTPEALDRLLESTGLWAPAFFILLYALGVCLFVPATLLSALGAAIFGPYLGFAYAWTGAMIGASGAFFIARFLGRDLAADLARGRLRKYDEAIGRNGFSTVLYLRLVYIPFTPTNFSMGLTRISFRDYFFGTGLGIMVGTFIFTFFIGTFREVLKSGEWAQLISGKTFLSVGLFVFSFFIPKIIKAVKQVNSDQ
jgi:uncharacterized membrane protein YdjX (TVP38/TMEM64 family)